VFLPYGLVPEARRHLGIFIFLVANGSGWYLERAVPLDVTDVTTLIVQPNVPQDRRWEIDALYFPAHQADETAKDKWRAGVESLYANLKNLTEQGLAGQTKPPELVIWPESSLYFPLEDSYHAEWLNQILAKDGITLALGADSMEGGRYNTLALLHGTVESVKPEQMHAKTHLVPFGEYLPLRGLLDGWLGELLPGDMDAGTKCEPLPMPVGSIEVMPSVCFEDTVPRVMRRLVRAAPQMMVNVTNDGWFRQSIANEQHWANVRLRSIELRRPLLQCANTGVSGIWRHDGALEARLPAHTATSQIVSVPVPTAPLVTLYAKWGDWFCALGLGLFLFACFQKPSEAPAF
jgi:apolipoprotein N-acyltransferase